MLAEWFSKNQRSSNQPIITNRVEIFEDGELDEQEELLQFPIPDYRNEGSSSATVLLVVPTLASLPQARSIDVIPSTSTNRPTTINV